MKSQKLELKIMNNQDEKLLKCDDKGNVIGFALKGMRNKEIEDITNRIRKASTLEEAMSLLENYADNYAKLYRAGKLVILLNINNFFQQFFFINWNYANFFTD